MIPVDLNRPIWQLTVGELLELINDQNRGVRDAAQSGEETVYVHGLRGIAELFGCSIKSAQKIKRSGKINPAITQVDRTIITDAKLALKLLKPNIKNRK